MAWNEGVVPDPGLRTSSAARAFRDVTFRHEAVLYDGRDGFARATVPFLRDAIDGGEPVLVMVEPRRMDQLRSALGPWAAHVHFRDMRSVGQNPARIIPAWQEFVAEHAVPGVRLRGIGEPVWAGRGRDEILECQQHEALLNVAFADASPFWLVCPYDSGALDQEVLAQVDHTHAAVADHDGHRRPGDTAPGGSATGLEGVLREPPPGHRRIAVGRSRLAGLRALVARIASEAGLSTARTADLLLALSEVVHNSVEHGAGETALRIWQEAGALVCEISDCGHIGDPLAGRRRPASDAERGRGLWLVNHLCDLVQLRSSPRGTVVRLHMRTAHLAVP